MVKLTPMMEQYLEIKSNYKYCILFFRLGDFYEMFFEDAMIASKELDIVLTGKSCGQEERAPMCGVPFHSADSYIAKLVEKGYKVAICEQVEDPKQAKGIVKRDVIRVITPGTVIDNRVLDETKNNYITAVYSNENSCSLALCDISTGEFQTTEITSPDADIKLINEIARLSPAEIICSGDFENSDLYNRIVKKLNITPYVYDNWYFGYNTAENVLCEHFKVSSLDGYGLKNKIFSVCASGALMQYLYDTQKNSLEHITNIKFFSGSDYMAIDIMSRRNLELTESLREKSKKGTLLWVVDKTKTAMGARLLRKWIEQPLVNIYEINKRLDSIEELNSNIIIRGEIKDILKSISDFERTISRIVYKNANCRDLISLKNSVAVLPQLKSMMSTLKSGYLSELYNNLDTLEDIYKLIDDSIQEDPPFTIREGGMIKKGFSSELDNVITARDQSSNWIQNLENKEREATGIKNLRIKYNKVFGYYIEITKSNINDVPDRYIRKQTLTNAERYTTPELDKLADVILGAVEKMVSLEYDIFCQIRDKISDETARIQSAAKTIAILDFIQSMAEVAEKNNYVKPNINVDGHISIKNGRHPVVEKMADEFIPNDTYIDNNNDRLSIITGPNMAGKSTYMRQVALITLMAQVGCFVPADSAEISIVDRIFTRVGASDDLASGQSTFMIEMIEVANILNNATNDSLIILDEIGRGTSTFDGVSIAWAVVEYIADKNRIGAKTLFATHYHELTELEGKLNGVKNYSISIEENGEDIIFLRKIVRGGSPYSYGIQVAKLAGVPESVIIRSKEILERLDEADITKKTKKIADESHVINDIEKPSAKVNRYDIKKEQIIDGIVKLDVMSLSPIQALQTLFDIQKKIKDIKV